MRTGGKKSGMLEKETSRRLVRYLVHLRHTTKEYAPCVQ